MNYHKLSVVHTDEEETEYEGILFIANWASWDTIIAKKSLYILFNRPVWEHSEYMRHKYIFQKFICDLSEWEVLNFDILKIKEKHHETK